MPTYRQIHEEQLREHRPTMYRDLEQSGELRAHLDEIAREAREMHVLTVQQMAGRHPYDSAEWKGSREAWEGWIERTAQELVLNDLILVPDEETEQAMPDGYTD